MNESGLKCILLTKIYDERESSDASHDATLPEQRVPSLPSNPVIKRALGKPGLELSTMVLVITCT